MIDPRLSTGGVSPERLQPSPLPRTARSLHTSACRAGPPILRCWIKIGRPAPALQTRSILILLQDAHSAPGRFWVLFPARNARIALAPSVEETPFLFPRSLPPPSSPVLTLGLSSLRLCVSVVHDRSLVSRASAWEALPRKYYAPG